MCRNVHKVLDRLGGDPQQLARFGAIVADSMESQEQATYECPICFVDGPADTFFSEACGHKVCCTNVMFSATHLECNGFAAPDFHDMCACSM